MDKKPLQSRTISELKRICKENDIEYGPKDTKKKLIEYLKELEDIKYPKNFPKGNKKSTKPSVFAHISSIQDSIKKYDSSTALEKSKMREAILEDLKNKIENYNWDIVDNKLKKRIEDFVEKLEKDYELSEPDSEISIDFEEGDDARPSIKSRIPHLDVCLKNYKNSKYVHVKRNALAELKTMLSVYNWKGYEDKQKETQNLIAGIKEIPSIEPPNDYSSQVPNISSKPKISPKKQTTKYVPGVYKELDLGITFNIVKKGQETKESTKKFKITLEEFRKEIKKPSFIKAFTNSAKELMGAKSLVYEKRLFEIKKEYEVLKLKVYKLKMAGTSNSTINELYPGFDTMGAYILDIENIVEIVKKKKETINEQDIEIGLEEAIEDPDDGISALMGRKSIKDQLASQLYSFSKGYKTFFGNFNNIVITGPAGSGKTRLAKTIAFAFSKVGILARGVVKIVTRTEIVGQYIGHTAPRTRGALLETLEGILFIDEAYQLTPCPEDKIGSKDFGSEAITEMVNFLDKYIGLNIVIVAGYENVMNRCFMTANEGLPRRFPYRYVLSPYTVSELTDILINNLKRKVRDGIDIDEEAGNYLYSLTDMIYKNMPELLGNQAGDMLNLSSNINNAINSSYHIQWINGNLENNKKIILAGFDDFLESKGYVINE